MKKRVEELVRQFREARKRRLRFEALMTALSVLVTGGVFWQLRRYGTAISDENVPAAELPEQAMPVVETDADPPDETARSGIAEEPEDWEAALPVFTDESAQQRIVAVARTQLGYTEGSGEVLLSDDGTSCTGYTRYGAWYGNPYGEWNTMFTYFCMYYAGIEKTDIPYGSGCWAWYEALAEKDMLTPCGSEQPGDIIFFDTDSDGEADRTGIVSGSAETDEGVTLSVIEGNCEGTVAEKQYLRGGSDMLGVLSAEPFITELSPRLTLMEYSADSESGIRVEAAAVKGVFPEGTVMYAVDVANDEAMQAAVDALGENANIRGAVAVDIKFITADGEEIEPKDGTSVAVQISLPAEKKLSGDIYTLVHVDDEGEGTLVSDAQVAANGAVFEAESFSIYVMTSSGRTAGNYTDGETIYLKVGDTIELTSEDYYSGAFNNGTFYVVGDNWDSVQRISFLSPAVYDRDSANNARTNGQYVVENYNGYWEGDNWRWRNERHRLTLTAENVTPERGSGSPGSGLYIQSPRGERYPVVITNKPHEPIMIQSSHGYKEINHIREWLGGYDGGTYGINFGNGADDNFFGLAKVDDYVPNSKERPYLLVVGEETIFYCDSVDPDATFTYTFEDGNGGSLTDLANIVIDPPFHPADNPTMWRHSVHFKVNDEDRYGYVHFQFTESGEEFWIRIWKEDTGNYSGQTMNHADMEIADGGTYTVSSSSVDEYGNSIVTVEVYQADVTWVNNAYILNSDGDVVEHFTSEADPDHPVYKKNPDGSQSNEMIGDYEQFGVPGGKQYELTSAWIFNTWTLPKFNTKLYDATEADTATFNVNLLLTPKETITYIVDPVTGELTEDPSRYKAFSLEEQETLRKPENDITFYMDHQDVIDARNKCPLNNGLDFTARAEFTVLNFPVKKVLKTGMMVDGQFTYDVIDLDNSLLTTCSNTPVLFEQAKSAKDGYAVKLPDTSPASGLSSMHQYGAFEIFSPDGQRGGHIQEADMASLMRKLQEDVFEGADLPYKYCQNWHDAYNMVVNGIRPPLPDGVTDENYHSDAEVTADEKKAFMEFIADYLESVYYPKSGSAPSPAPIPPDTATNTFKTDRDGYLLVMDHGNIAASGSVIADPDDPTKGTADLNGMRFFIPEGETEHYFHFAVHERIPVDLEGITYDDEIIYFDVKVEKVEKNGKIFLTAHPIFYDDEGNEVTGQQTATFINHYIELPETGGTGILPYLAGGMILISAAFILPLIRRRKEDECDS